MSTTAELAPLQTSLDLSKQATPATFPTKDARKAFFKAKLMHDAKWALRGLAQILARQTTAEQIQNATTDENGVGFTGSDAEILTRFAQQAAAWNPATSKFPSPLSPKQMDIVFHKMPKYAGQLIAIAEAAGKCPVVKVPKAKAATTAVQAA